MDEIVSETGIKKTDIEQGYPRLIGCALDMQKKPDLLFLTRTSLTSEQILKCYIGDE